MRSIRSILALAAVSAFAAQANDGLDLAARSKMSAASYSVRSASASAPFMVGPSDGSVEAMLRAETPAPGLRTACDRATIDVCYDAAEGRIVYKPARAYMPQFEGLKAESVSLRRDRIVLKYTFR